MIHDRLRERHNHDFPVFSPQKSGPLNVSKACTVSLDKAPWRPRPGEIITIRDESGRHFRGRVFKISEHTCDVRIFECLIKSMESHLDILLLQALPDKERMEWIIQKATELGVNTIVPFHSRRSITLEEREKRQKKAHRWPIIAKKAAQQCRRASVPIIQPYTDFSHALRYAADADLKISMWEKERLKGLNETLTDQMHPRHICILVGPEGGLTEKEIRTARASGFISLGLGPRILRTETAAIAIIAIIQHRWGDLK